VQRVIRHIRVLWRSELEIAEARLRAIVRRSILLLLAGLIALAGLCMLNVAAFFMLETRYGTVWAAVAMALGDFVIAVAVAGIALASRSGSRLQAALEHRQAAIGGIEDEFSALRDQIALPLVLIPLITAIIRGMRKNKPDPQ
jgi:hypothetical protein